MGSRRVARFAATGVLATLALRCTSFEGQDVPTADAGVGQPEGGDGGAPTTEPRFCASAQAGQRPHLFCADFDDERREAWRGNRREALWMDEGDAGLSLVIAPEGRSPPNALLVTSGQESGGTFSLGSLAYQTPSVDGVRVELDMRVERQASTSGLGVYLSVLKLETTDADFELRIMTGNAALTRVGTETLTFEPGFPPLFETWRHVVLDISGRANAQSIQVTVDGETALAQTVTGPFPAFPTSVKLRVGAVVYDGGPFAVRVDNLTVDEH